MINDNEMLNYVLQNAEMGCNGISAVRKQLKDNKVDGVLCEQLIKYSKLYHCANTMLKKARCGCTPCQSDDKGDDELCRKP